MADPALNLSAAFSTSNEGTRLSLRDASAKIDYPKSAAVHYGGRFPRARAELTRTNVRVDFGTSLARWSRRLHSHQPL
jgi:hypothetical protein